MSTFQPYDIIHIDIYKLTYLQLPADNSHGKYFVCWYKSIALGDFYIEPGQELNAEEFRNGVIAAIAPTLKLYQRGKNEASLGWPEWLIKNQPKDWAGQIENILSYLFADDLPKSVPISVVICTRNRPGPLMKCLQSIDRSTVQPEEIIVIDNAPSDDSTFNVVSKFEKVIHLREPKAGLSNARNTGIKNAGKSIIAFTDDDVLVDPLWAYRLWKSFQDERVVAMTGLVITSCLDTEAQYIFEKHWSFNRGYIGKIYDKTYFESNLKIGPPVWQIGAGANMAFRKSVFKELGNFNEFLGAGASGCSEDSEMWFRILAKGYKIIYEPKAITFHEHRKEMKSLKSQVFNYMRGFAVAALMQQRQLNEAAYKKHLFRRMPRYYFSLLLKGFPLYKKQFQTLGVEIQGLLSGIRYYQKHFSRLVKSIGKKYE
ncbi:MAG: glycosyltransferase [Ginsengibacter sp.]